MDRRRRLLDERLDLIRRPRAGRSRDFLAAGEYREHRDRSNVVALTEIAELVGVDLDDEHRSGLPLRDLLQLWRDHSARTEPRRPIFDYHRQIRSRVEPVHT